MSDIVHLLDVNIMLALTMEDHIHHSMVEEWFSTPGLRWCLCAFAEAAFLRYMTGPRLGKVDVSLATSLLHDLIQNPGYSYLPIQDDWQTLCSPFFPRLHGTKQITDAYLLGLAVRNRMTLVTLDKAIAHLAGSLYRDNLMLLEAG